MWEVELEHISTTTRLPSFSPLLDNDPPRPLRPAVLSSELGLEPEPRERLSRDVLAKVNREAERIVERVDVGLAAGCVYGAARSRLERVTQTELADCVDVRPVTVRSRWEELRSMVEDAAE